MFGQNTFPGSAPTVHAGRRRESWMTDVSPRKVLRVAVVLAMSFLCWMGVGCFAFEILQLAGR
jgi:hypothetical protein